MCFNATELLALQIHLSFKTIQTDLLKLNLILLITFLFVNIILFLFALGFLFSSLQSFFGFYLLFFLELKSLLVIKSPSVSIVKDLLDSFQGQLGFLVQIWIVQNLINQLLELLLGLKVKLVLFDPIGGILGHLLAQLSNESFLGLELSEHSVLLFGLKLLNQLLNGLLLVLEDFLPKVRVIQKDFLLLGSEVDSSFREGVGSIDKGIVGNSCLLDNLVDILVLFLLPLIPDQTQDSFLKKQLDLLGTQFLQLFVAALVLVGPAEIST